jgi:hypothetical protein
MVESLPSMCKVLSSYQRKRERKKQTKGKEGRQGGREGGKERERKREREKERKKENVAAVFWLSSGSHQGVSCRFAVLVLPLETFPKKNVLGNSEPNEIHSD